MPLTDPRPGPSGAPLGLAALLRPIAVAALLPALPVAALLLLFALAACGGGGGGGGTGPKVDTPPSVQIQEVALEGLQENDLRVTALATDDTGLDSVQVYMDGAKYERQIIHGTQAQFQAVRENMPSGNHTLELRVFDEAGKTGSASSGFTVPQTRNIYDAMVFIVRGDSIVPAAGSEFCFGQRCTTVEQDGGAVITDYEQPYELGFIEGANPNFLVALGESRLAPNIIQYTNADALEGRKPTDTRLEQGTNKRTILYWDSASVPMQELIDTFNDEEGRNYNFSYDGAELMLYIFGGDYAPPQEVADSLVAAAQRGVAFANQLYERVPWEVPNTYDLEYGGLRNQDTAELGTITLRFNGTNRFERRDYNVEPDGFYEISSILADTTNLAVALDWIEMNVGAMLTGVPGYAQPEDGAFISLDRRTADHLDATWTVRDRQIALIDLIFDHQSSLTRSGKGP